MTGKPSSRWLVRSLVVLTALLCLGLAGYAGQVWWAKRVARSMWNQQDRHKPQLTWGGPDAHSDQLLMEVYCSAWDENSRYELLTEAWKETPWYGRWWLNGKTWEERWIPKRTFYELAKLGSDQDYGNSSSDWEIGFNTHHFDWDPQQRRLVEGPLKVRP